MGVTAASGELLPPTVFHRAAASKHILSSNASEGGSKLEGASSDERTLASFRKRRTCSKRYHSPPSLTYVIGDVLSSYFQQDNSVLVYLIQKQNKYKCFVRQRIMQIACTT